eukprot:2451157-Pleurochrysis_carterae.AAC.1
MEGSTRGGEVCELLTSFVSCVVRCPRRRELPCLQAAQSEREASEGGVEYTRGAGERQGLESTAAHQSLR